MLSINIIIYIIKLLNACQRWIIKENIGVSNLNVPSHTLKVI